MHTTHLLALALRALTALAVSPANDDDPFTKRNISARGITASFIAYGARLTNLYVPDVNGTMRDVVLGYDDGRRYLQDTATNHTYMGPIVGRYANRIRNGTFTVRGRASHVVENEHGGRDTLHGGAVGYDQQNFTVVAHNASSITFSFLDVAQQGFPGSVVTYATYSVAPGQWTVRMVSIPLDEPTPIMLANHVYWNLGAFVDAEATTILNNTLSMPYSARYIEVDAIAVPTGGLAITNGSALDFYTAPQQIGHNITGARFTSYNVTGIDNAFILDRPRSSGPEATDLTVLTLASNRTGIAMALRTNQQSLQLYTCNAQNGSVPLKASQRRVLAAVPKYGCIVIETQQWIDGINNPQWGQDQFQIYSPETEPAVVWAQYDFSTFTPEPPVAVGKSESGY